MSVVVGNLSHSGKMTSPENDNREIPPQLETEKSTGIDQGYFLRLCQPYLPTEGTLLRKRQPFTRDVKVLLPSEKELKPLPFRPRPIITLMKDLPAQKEDVQKETHAPVRSYADMSIFSQVHRSQKLPSQLQKRAPLRYHLTTTSTQGLLKQKPTSKQQLLKERFVLAHPIVPRCCGSVKMEKPQLIDVNRCIAEIHRSQCPGNEYFHAAYVTHLVDQNMDHLVKKMCFSKR